MSLSPLLCSLMACSLMACDGGSFSFGSAADGTSDEGVFGSGEECDESILPGDIVGPDCLSGALACGQSLAATTEGGESSLHGGDYQSWYCMTALDSEWTGNERMYEFDHPGTGTVRFALSSPCGDLSLVVLAWSDRESCPYPGVSVAECESDDGVVEIWNNSPTRYVVIVDGLEDQSFSLSASCPSSDP